MAKWIHSVGRWNIRIDIYITYPLSFIARGLRNGAHEMRIPTHSKGVALLRFHREKAYFNLQNSHSCSEELEYHSGQNRRLRLHKVSPAVPLTRFPHLLLWFNLKMLMFLLTGFFGVWPNFTETLNPLADGHSWRENSWGHSIPLCHFSDHSFVTTLGGLQRFTTKRLDDYLASFIVKYLGALLSSLNFNICC